MLGDELAQMLRLLGLRKKRLVSLMPLLEFITWSLLKEDSEVGCLSMHCFEYFCLGHGVVCKILGKFWKVLPFYVRKYTVKNIDGLT